MALWRKINVRKRRALFSHTSSLTLKKRPF
jgi:hypothetical protein